MQLLDQINFNGPYFVHPKLKFTLKYVYHTKNNSWLFHIPLIVINKPKINCFML